MQGGESWRVLRGGSCGSKRKKPPELSLDAGGASGCKGMGHPPLSLLGAGGIQAPGAEEWGAHFGWR